MRIALLGLGLVGGSIARALRAREPGRWTVTSWTPGGRGPAAGVRHGVVARQAGDVADAISDAELVVLAAPPLDSLALLDTLRPPPDATITDVVSTKRAIGAAADRLGLPFVGGHPMAGRETVGFDAATPDLFVDRPWVIVPGAGARPIDLARVESLALATGARPVEMDAATHDRAVAAISHLPLVLAATLVEAVTGGAEWPTARELAAGGWRDMTRLARGDVAMGAGIAATNADALAEGIAGVREVLDRWLAELAPGGGNDPDAAALEARLAAARSALEDGPEG